MNTLCLMHTTLDKRRKTLVKVTEAIARLGHTFHNVPILQDCARVQVIKVNDKYLDCDLDYLDDDEGIDTLE